MPRTLKDFNALRAIHAQPLVQELESLFDEIGLLQIAEKFTTNPEEFRASLTQKDQRELDEIFCKAVYAHDFDTARQALYIGARIRYADEERYVKPQDFTDSERALHATYPCMKRMDASLPLHVSVDNEDLAAVIFLVTEAGADVNTKNYNYVSLIEHCTKYHYSTQAGRAVAQFLLDAGAKLPVQHSYDWPQSEELLQGADASFHCLDY